jgi:hypothetical protein
VVSDQLAQVALPSDEADDRDGTVGVLGLDETARASGLRG